MDSPPVKGVMFSPKFHHSLFCLYKFKKSFYKGDDTRFDIGKKIYNVDLYNELVDIASKNKSLDENYFPLYRS